MSEQKIPTPEEWANLGLLELIKIYSIQQIEAACEAYGTAATVFGSGIDYEAEEGCVNETKSPW